MHILIVGGRGQLGLALQRVYAQKEGIQLSVWARPEYDITSPAIADHVAALGPAVVINAAAWTNVDGAESAPTAAYATNALGPKYLAEGCAQTGAVLVQISTNEVFAGRPNHFYREYDQPAPQSVYARSKLAGEIAVQQTLRQCYVVRTAWLFAPGGVNFPSKILAAADKHGQLRVVADEIGNPTYAPDVAAAIVQLVQSDRYGIYHLVNEGYASRFTFAQALLQATDRGHIPLTPIAAAEWPRPAAPPLHAVLVNQAAAALAIQLRPWQDALHAYVAAERNRKVNE
ncbi:MAG: dTDP-4-dehydrorhamnose reductase [Caldilineaceae bacterium]